MFSIDFLHRVREHEIEEIVRYLPAGARVLELGGGSGAQAKQLAERGYRVVSVDVGTSNYKEQRIFPVLEYDGAKLPFWNGSFDVVFSSNVLEHIRDPGPVYQELARVLAPGGCCVHIMPTAVWRGWTSLMHYADLLQQCLRRLPSVIPRGAGRAHLRRAAGSAREIINLIRGSLLPPRHGETGTVWSELRTFSRRHWLDHFRAHGFDVLDVHPMDLFYTGYMVLGPRWSLASRARAARLLGSACILYRVRPMAAAARAAGAGR